MVEGLRLFVLFYPARCLEPKVGFAMAQGKHIFFVRFFRSGVLIIAAGDPGQLENPDKDPPWLSGVFMF